jgi:hypothetical protein
VLEVPGLPLQRLGQIEKIAIQNEQPAFDGSRTPSA